ncbi:plasma membrane proteolipid 3 [Paraphaeosphaeria sporulosa]
MGAIKLVLLILATIFFPPIGVFAVAGCGADFFINICLTILGYIPGHIHAFYLIYVFYERKDEVKNGVYNPRPASGIFSERVLRGGRHVPAAVPVQQPVAQPNSVPQPQPGQVLPAQAYGTV